VEDRAGAARPVIRTAVAADLPSLQQVFTAASLSNAGDAPLLLARPEFLVFTGDGIPEGRTRVATTGSEDGDRLVGFATVAVDPHGGLELEDLFVDPERRRRGIACQLVLDAAGTARRGGHRRLTVTGNPHALAFYRAVGFIEVGQAATALGYGLRMQLDLSRN
jgi:ribosomal protein S18 acetylase RimI-like enzyme